MSIKTQLKLAQISGSFGQYGINDQVGAVATGSLAAQDLEDILSHMAGAIKRIHGADSFSQSGVGEFHHSQGIKTNLIGEATSNQGVTIDGVKLKDNDIVFPGDASTISSNSTTDLLTFGANDVTVKATKSLKVDLVAESGSGAGVTVDGVLLKDGDVILTEDRFIGTASDVDMIKLNGSANEVEMAGNVTLKVDTINESDSAAGVTVEGVLLKDNDIVIPNGSTIGSVGAANAITIAADGKVTLVGDLDVQGATTTINSSNLTVEDSIIALGHSGSALGPAHDRGIIFGMDGAYMGSPALFYDYGSTSSGIPTGMFKLALTTNSGSEPNGAISQNFSADNNSAGIYGGSLPLQVSQIHVDDVVWTETGMPGTHTCILGMEWPRYFDANRRITFGINDGDRNIILSGNIKIEGNTDFKVSSNKIAASPGSSIEIYGARKLNQDLTMTSSVQFEAVSGSNGLHANWSNPVYFHDQDNSHYVRIKAPSTVSSNVTLTLPDNDGDNGQALLTNGSGVLTWGSPSASGVAADDLSVGDAAVTLATSTGNITIDAQGNDSDIVFKGTDGGSDVTFLTLDGSDAGAASFNGVVTANAGLKADNITIDGNEIDLSSGDLVIDVAGDLELNADGGNIVMKDGSDTMIDFVANGTTYVTLDCPGDIRLDAGGMDVNLLAGGNEFGRLSDDGSGHFAIRPGGQDKDLLIKGNDNGSIITALTLDMSEAGKATFNSSIVAGGSIQVASAGLLVADSGGSAPSTPSSGYGVFYVSGDMPFFKSDGGTAMSLAPAMMTGTHPTKVQYTVTGTHQPNVDLNINAGQGSANFLAAGGHGNAGVDFVDVFVNGQLLLSGTGGSLANADYVLVPSVAGNLLKFAFKLESNDIVSIKRIRQS